MSRQLHQLVHTLSYGDAISGEVLALQRCAQELGFESEIFAIHVHPKLKGMARDYKELPTSFGGVLVLHYSLGSPLNELYLGMERASRTLIYHNLTPAKWFAGVNPRIVADIEQGLRELPELCRHSALILADSSFNAGEIKELGFAAQVLELPIDPHRWQVETNPGIASLVKSEGGLHLLHVGRLAPNKCIEDIIRTFHYIHHYICKHSRLWLVGIDIDTELYSFSLKRLAYDLGVDQAINFAGCMADSEVKALYENASVYMCMSEHEGFCLPVVEAMHFGLPVLAYSSSALPETVGSGGVLVSEKRHSQLAELVYEMYSNTALRDKLVSAGREQVKALSYGHFAIRVNELFGKSVQMQTAANVR
jgi:glycosyltransferase involved in cell wall biosynthesis